MNISKEIGYCNKCNSEVMTNYCSHCGFPKTPKRIDKKYILNEIRSVLNFDKGIFYTIKMLVLQPGKSIREFITLDRNRLVKPIVFVIICSLLYTFSQQWFGFKDGYMNYSFNDDSITGSIFSWISANYGYANMLMSVFIALWIKVFFRKYNYNFFEILILLCFVMGMGMLFFSFFGILESIVGLGILDKTALLGIVYMAWAIGQFFDKKKYLNYLKAFISYFLGMIVFVFIVSLVGTLLDFIIK